MGYDMSDRVWMKTPYERCTSPYTRGRVTGVISPQNVDRMPRHVRDLCPVIGLNTSKIGSDSEFSTWSTRMITINETCSDPLEVNNAYAMDDTSVDESSEEELLLPRKRSAPGCRLCEHRITRWGSEIERQNPQTTASDEPSGVHHSKRQRVACCICRQNNRRLRESSNHPRLDKKQVVSRTKKRN